MAFPAIEMHDVSKRFGTSRALDHLELSVEVGAVFGFLGPNGAGKTTTLRVLLGLVRPDLGRVEVLGHDPGKEPTRIRQLVGVLLESDGLYERLTAVDNLLYHAGIHHLPRTDARKRIEELLRAFDLWERRRDRVLTWSKGMRQKLAIARALLHKPRVLLLDEPFTGLDPVAAAALRNDIVNLAKNQGVTVMLTTHDLAHVEKSCSHVAVIKGGRVIASGPLEQLRGKRDDVEVEVSGEGLDAEVLAALQHERMIMSFSLAGNRCRLRCSPSARARLGVELVKRGVQLDELHTVRSSLEETFLSLMSEAAA
jgi:ABC-2 type transport system ATP-binding protein